MEHIHWIVRNGFWSTVAQFLNQNVDVMIFTVILKNPLEIDIE